MNEILYSQCWEDPLVLEKALMVSSSDRILSISSAGDNTLYLLSKSPKEVISLDINKGQNFLLELKAVAIKNLDYNNFLQLIGFVESDKRMEIYDSLKIYLSEDCKKYWDERLNLIKEGTINIGKFERYLSLFRRYILPISHSKKDCQELIFPKSSTAQKEFYKNIWDNYRWRATFKFFFSKTILKLLGRDKVFFKYGDTKSVSEHYLGKAKIGLTQYPGNHFLRYIVLGNYDLSDLPEYARKENYNKIKENISRLKIINGELKSFLQKTSEKEFNKFNLSDVFEVYSQEDYDYLIKEISRVSKNGAIICYWNNLVDRSKHAGKMFFPLFNKMRLLTKKDRVFFYSRLMIEKLM